MAGFLALTRHVLRGSLGSQPPLPLQPLPPTLTSNSLVRGGRGIRERQSTGPEFPFILASEEFQRLPRLCLRPLLCAVTRLGRSSPTAEPGSSPRDTWAPSLEPATHLPFSMSARGHGGPRSRTQPQLVSHPHACPSEAPQAPGFWTPGPGKGHRVTGVERGQSSLSGTRPVPCG